MWILKKVNTEIKFYILDKEKYVVSRISGHGDLILSDDSSISRTHAYLYPAADHIKLIDCGSKYGTYTNENINGNVQMVKDIPHELHIGDRIRFGRLENLWAIDRQLEMVLTSSLREHDSEQLVKSMKILNGTILNEWSMDCTHITMSGIIVTVKLLQCMVAGIPIVTQQYWQKYIEAVRENNTSKLPNPSEFLPPIIEQNVSYANNISFEINLNRKRLFTNKTFVFMFEKHLDKFKIIIELANGQCYSLDKRKTRSSALTKPNIIVIQYTSSSTQSQNYSSIQSLSEYLQKKDVRMIPDCEIGLAILSCSLDRFCNPQYKIVDNLNQKTENLFEINTQLILAEDTVPMGETDQKQNKTTHNTVNVPETVQSTCNDVENECRINDDDDDCDDNIDDEVKSSNIFEVDNTKKWIENEQQNQIKSIDGKRKASPIATTTTKRTNYGEQLNSLELLATQQPKTQSQQINTNEFISKRAIVNKSINKSIGVGSDESQNSSQMLMPRANVKRPFNLLENNDADDDDLFAFGGNLMQNKKLKSSNNQQKFNSAKDIQKTKNTIDKDDVNMNIDDDDDDDDDNDNNLFSFNRPLIKSTLLLSQQKQQNLNLSTTVTANITEKYGDNELPRMLPKPPIKPIFLVKPVELKFENGWLSKSFNKCSIIDADNSPPDSSLVIIKKEQVSDAIDTVDNSNGNDSKIDVKNYHIHIKVLNLISRTSSLSSSKNISGDDSIGGDVSHQVKNFKSFTKKFNYIAQTRIVTTNPVLV